MNSNIYYTHEIKTISLDNFNVFNLSCQNPNKYTGNKNKLIYAQMYIINNVQQCRLEQHYSTRGLTIKRLGSLIHK